jgi:BirA family biotin operon repressor/biotin-[acetyl-CoA-carboxylase] ligase
MKSLLLNHHLVDLIELLSDGQYHDGETIGRQLNMTRSAVWKAIKKLKQYDITIHAIKNKGYALLEPLKLLNKKNILDNIKNNIKNISPQEVEIFEHIDSTNNYLKLFFNQPGLRICLAEMQTKGRGRLHRDWYSPFGQNIYLSSFYFFHRDISDLAGLSLVVSLAVVKTLMPYRLSHPVLVKWPNDVICDGKKLSGSLVEVQAEANDISRAIIGVGLNVNMLHNKDHCISQPWVSLRELVGYYIDRNQLCVNLIQHLFAYLQKFEKHGFACFLEEWNMVDGLKGQAVNLKSIGAEINGQVKGISEQGHLLLKLDNGLVKSFSSGEIEKLNRTL